MDRDNWRRHPLYASIDVRHWQSQSLYAAGGMLALSALIYCAEAFRNLCRRRHGDEQVKSDSRLAIAASTVFLASMLLAVLAMASMFWHLIPGSDKISVSIPLSPW